MPAMEIRIAKTEAGASPPRSRWAVWTSAPHRVMFLPGALQLVATMLLTAWEVGGRYLALWPVPPWVAPPAWGHGWLMIFGLFPWFVFGFAMTAVPNWTKARMARAWWIGAALPMLAGTVLLYAGFFTGRAVIAAGGLLHLAGWTAGTVALARLVVAARSRDVQAIAIAVLLAVGGAASALLLAGIVREEAAWIAVAANAGVWLFLLPLFLVVAHRLVPFFSSRVLSGYAVYRPAFSLPFLAAACALHFVLESAGLLGWTWVADSPMAAWVGWLAWKWGLAQSFRARLLAMLHVSLAVLSAALAVSSLASLATLAGMPGMFGRGPLHLLAVGYFAAMTLGMVSRVSLGHSGRALEADRLTWYGFLAIIGVGAARALADFLPLAGLPRSVLLAASAVGWVAVAGAWAVRFVPMYLSPRPDGRAG